MIEKLKFTCVPVANEREASEAEKLAIKAGYKLHGRLDYNYLSQFLMFDNRYWFGGKDHKQYRQLTLSELREIVLGEGVNEGENEGVEVLPEHAHLVIGEGMFQDDLINYLDGGIENYEVYRFKMDSVDEYFCPSVGLWQSFLSQYGKPSPNIFDFDSSGLCNASDLLKFAAAYGDSSAYDPEWLDDVTVWSKQSSGWICTHPDYDVLFVKVTPYDEDGDYTPDTLKSFYIEAIPKGGTNDDMFRVWFFKK